MEVDEAEKLFLKSVIALLEAWKQKRLTDSHYVNIEATMLAVLVAKDIVDDSAWIN